MIEERTLKLTPLRWALSTTLEGEKKPSLNLEWECNSKRSFSPPLPRGFWTPKSSTTQEEEDEDEAEGWSKKTHSLTNLKAKTCSWVIFFLLPPLLFFFLFFFLLLLLLELEIPVVLSTAHPSPITGSAEKSENLVLYLLKLLG